MIRKTMFWMTGSEVARSVKDCNLTMRNESDLTLGTCIRQTCAGLFNELHEAFERTRLAGSDDFTKNAHDFLSDGMGANELSVDSQVQARF